MWNNSLNKLCSKFSINQEHSEGLWKFYNFWKNRKRKTKTEMTFNADIRKWDCGGKTSRKCLWLFVNRNCSKSQQQKTPAHTTWCVDVVKKEKGNKRILHQLHWDCPALHPVQSLCWTHYHLSARMGSWHIHWGEPKSPHVLHPPVYLFLWQRDLWSLLRAPAFYGAQVAQPETIPSVIRRHWGCFRSQCDHQISVNFSPIN